METKWLTMGSPLIGAGEIEAVVDVLKSGWITQGPRTIEFESRLLERLTSKHAICMNNGTSTLIAALMALGVKRGDVVLVPDITYISTINSIYLLGAHPRILPVSQRTFNIEPETIRECIDRDVVGVITVDMKGMPVDYTEISKICTENGIFFLSDSAESFGAEYKGTPLGSHADIYSYSFFANKNITTGEGGALCTDSPALAAKLRRIRNQGQGEMRYVHTDFGLNFRFTDVSAAIGIAQLKRLDDIFKRKQQIVSFYNQELPGLGVLTPYVPSYVTKHSWYNYSIIFEDQQRCAAVEVALASERIEFRKSFPPLHTQPIVESLSFTAPLDLKGSIDIYKRMLDLPCTPTMTTNDAARVVEVIARTA